MSRFSGPFLPSSLPSHLSDEAVTAFADGVLGNGARQRAEQHLGACAECRDAVRDQRAASAVLRGAPAPSLPAGLTDRLLRLPMTASMTPSPFAPAALGADSRPMFAAFSPNSPNSAEAGQRSMPTAVPPPPPAPAPAAAVPTADGVPIIAAPAPQNPLLPASPGHPTSHRRAAATAGLGALAVSALAVSLLASTAASAGGVTPRPTVPAVGGATPAPAAVVPVVAVDGGTVAAAHLDLTGTR